LNQLILTKTWQKIPNYPAILPANLNWIILDILSLVPHVRIASNLPELKLDVWRLGAMSAMKTRFATFFAERRKQAVFDFYLDVERGRGAQGA
jgi:hypothetical protein